MDNKKIGKIIAKRRKEKGLTQNDLADILSVSNKTISKWETGGGLPDISLLIDLSKALDISIDDLLQGNDVESATINYDKSFLIRKSFYKKYMIAHYFEKHLYWFIDFLAVMSILCGLACIPLNNYLSTYMDIIGKIFIIAGILMIFIPIIKIMYQVYCFQEYEVYYSIKDDGLLYQQNGEAVFYYFSQLEMIIKKQFVILQKQKTILWISSDDVSTIQSHLQEKKKSYQKFKFILALFLSISIVSCLVLQLGYLIVLKRFGFEYIYNQMEIVFYIIIICGLITIYILLKKDIKQCIVLLVSSIALTFIVYIFLSNQSSLQVIDSYSPNFQNRAVLKYDTLQKKIYEYHYTYLCFAKKSDTASISFMMNKKGYWLTNDCYILTYKDQSQNQQAYITTFGDRGDGISYFNIAPALQGEWFNVNEGETKTYMNVEKGEITIKTNDKLYTYTASEIKQNGTIALTLYQGELPKYVIVLNENCQLDENNLINKKGTIQVVDLQDFSTATLYCGTYKEDKEEQQAIDDNMRQQAIELVNKMDNLLKNDAALKDYKDSSQMFKLTSESEDYFTVTRDAYLQYLNLFHDKNIAENGQIDSIKVIAGDIHDFYVEMSYTATTTYHGETETATISPKYRIKQGNGCYLIATIGYRVPGNVGLVSLDPVLEKDTSQNSDYTYSIKGE